MEDALPILDYLPTTFAVPGEQEYVRLLWAAFESNYEQENFQFAMLPFHMLYMSFVYFSVWQIKLMRPKEFGHSAIFVPNEERKKLMTATSPFTFSVVNERSVFKFLKLIGCEDQHTGDFARLVDDRNELAHSNGLISCRDQKAADTRLAKVLRQVGAIQGHMTPVLFECLRAFLVESCDPNVGRQYDLPRDQIRELLVHKHYFSIKDIETCLTFDVQALSTEPHFAEIKILFDEFSTLYTAELAG